MLGLHSLLMDLADICLVFVSGKEQIDTLPLINILCTSVSKANDDLLIDFKSGLEDKFFVIAQPIDILHRPTIVSNSRYTLA